MSLSRLALARSSLGLERARIDREERVAGLYVLSFAEVDFGHLAADFRLDRNRRVGFHGTDLAKFGRHRFLHGDRGYHRHRFFAEDCAAVAMRASREQRAAEKTDRGERSEAQRRNRQ